MYTNEKFEIILEDEQVISGGITYPSSFPKSEIKSLIKVKETVCPEGDVILGYHIDKNYTQVWDYREKTTEELAEEKRQSLLKEIYQLESQITNRRIREAMLTGDYAFINDIENKINELRKELK